MARPRKNGQRARGIQGKNGYLYVVISQTKIVDSEKKNTKRWISTGLKDTPDNLILAINVRKKVLNRKIDVALDINIKLCDYLEVYLEKKKREVADTTYSSYYYRARKIKAYFGDIKVRDLNERLVERFLDDLFEIDNLQPRYVKDIKVFFSGVLDQACRDGIMTFNPIKDVVVNKALAASHKKEKDEDEEFFSYEEAKLFLDRIQDDELYELYYCTIFFGLRREELLGLRWKAIDFNKATLIINHTVTIGTKINRNNTTKTESSMRTYPLTADQINMFRRLKDREGKNRKLFGDCYSENDYIFKHVDGTEFYPGYPGKAFKKIIKAIPELPQAITFHGLRKSCVSILVHQGMNVKNIQKWVGHRDIETTLKIYAKVKEKEAKRAVSEAMSDVLPVKKYE